MSDFRSEQGYLRACTQASCFARIIRWCKWWYVLLLFPSLTFLSVWCRLNLGTRKRSPWKSPSTPNTQEIRTRIYFPLPISFEKFSSLFRPCSIAIRCFLSFFLPHWRVSWWNQPKSAEFVFFPFFFVFCADGELQWQRNDLLDNPAAVRKYTELISKLPNLKTTSFRVQLASFALFFSIHNLFNHKQICGDDAIKELIACSCDIMPPIVLHVSLSILLILFDAELTFV